MKTAHARQTAMYLSHVLTGLTMTQVGQYFGRDRTTVSHACGVIEDMRDDPVFNAALELIERDVMHSVGQGPGGTLQLFDEECANVCV